MSLNIELAEPEMAALTELAQAQGRERAECASDLLAEHLRRPDYANGDTSKPKAFTDLLNEMQGGEPRKLRKSQIESLQGKYSHLGASSENIAAERRAEANGTNRNTRHA